MTTPHSVSRIGAPTSLAISLPECKNFLKIDYDEDDELLSKMITAAAQKFENYTSQSLINQEWQATYKQFCGDHVTLPTYPVSKITNVETISYSGEHIKFPERLYNFDQHSQILSFKVFPFGYFIKIEYTSGYGEEPYSIPDNIQTALLNHIAHMYENRALSAPYPLSNYDEFKTMRL